MTKETFDVIEQEIDDKIFVESLTVLQWLTVAEISENEKKKILISLLPKEALEIAISKLQAILKVKEEQEEDN
jgi:hypothetical protein